MNLILVWVISFSTLLTSSFAASTTNYLNAIKKKYPNCEYKKENLFLTKKQKSSIEKQTGKELFSRLGLRFAIKCKKAKSYAYIDSHVVRTLNETLVIFINENSVKDLKIVAFNEPPEYKTPEKWNAQFQNKTLKDKLSVGVDIDGLTGATLSTHAVNNSVKRVLSIHGELKVEQN